MADTQHSKRGGRFKDLTGLRFANVVVVSFVGIDNNKKPLYEIVCDCGTRKTVVGASLVSGLTVSCGCVRAQKAKERRIASGKKEVNGRSETREAKSWKSIQQRCNNPNNPGYYKYGGRGICVCEGILGSLEVFLKAVGGDRPEGHTVDRIDNSGSYSCGECNECISKGWTRNIRWATIAQQARNKRTNVMLEFRGKTQCLTDWCKEVGLSIHLVSQRLRYGWTVDRALTTAVGPTRNPRKVKHGLDGG